MGVLVLQRMFLEFVLDVLYFPLWWYTTGLLHVLKTLWGMLVRANYSLAPGLWLKNIFVPMFGQTDWQGRFMSIFMRFVNVIGRSIALLFYTAFLLLLLAVWLVLPILTTWMLVRSLL